MENKFIKYIQRIETVIHEMDVQEMKFVEAGGIVKDLLNSTLANQIDAGLNSIKESLINGYNSHGSCSCHK